MQLSGIIPPFAAITGASNMYKSAIDKLTSPNELPFAVIADGARSDTLTAIDLLTPHAQHGDMFTQRNATSSITAARDAVAMIDQLNNPAGDTGVTIDDVVAKLTTAEQALWYE